MKKSSWSWKNEDELMSELREIQNSPEFWYRNITSVVEMFNSKEQLLKHIQFYREKLSKV